MKALKKIFSVLLVLAMFFSMLTVTFAEQKKINLVATTTMLADLAMQIAGDTADVTALMGAGVDPHLYQASAGDVSKLQNADVVLYNGLHLEGKMGDIFANLTNSGKNIICAQDGIDKELLLADEEDAELYDPHIWFDANIWKQVANWVAAEMIKLYPENEQLYSDNLAAYSKELDDLNTYINEQIQLIPEQSRIMITAHDAFRYFAKAYGIEVKGLQGISTEAEAGTADISSLADFIVDRKIKAIFIESSVPTKTIEALQAAVKAKGFETNIGGELYSDSLGDEASGHETYIKTVKANVDTLVGALK